MKKHFTRTLALILALATVLSTVIFANAFSGGQALWSFDEKTGKAKYKWEVFTSEKVVKDRIPKKVVRVVRHKAENEIHSKVAEIAEENDAVKAVHKTEQTGEGVVREIKRHKRTKQQKLQRKVKKLEKKEVRANTKYQYEKFKKEHPEFDDSFRKRMSQKRRIRKEYAKKFREQTVIFSRSSLPSENRATLTVLLPSP